jgi:methyl-accepting chemotaxis protein
MQDQKKLIDELTRSCGLITGGDTTATIKVEDFSGESKTLAQLFSDTIEYYRTAVLDQKERIKKLADEAEKQKQFAYTMVMQNPQPQLIVSIDMKIKLANEAFTRMSGIPASSATTMSIRSFKVLEKSGHNVREAIETKKGVSGFVTVEFPTGIRYLEQHSIPMLDKAGNLVSLMTVYNDLTEKRNIEKTEKELAEFTSSYLSTLGKNLSLLSTGDLNFDLTIPEAHESTKKASEGFRVINASLTMVRDHLQALIRDTDTLTRAAAEGNLNKRADAAKHQGEYRKIIEGFNSTLDKMIEPVEEAIRVSN